MAPHLLKKLSVVFLSSLLVAECVGGAAKITILASLSGSTAERNGDGPYAGLLLGMDGSFYGTTHQGGTGTNTFPSGLGTIFRIQPSGSIATLISFDVTNGAQPYAGLTQLLDGNIYGTTLLGGTSNLGTLFRLTTNGSLTTLLSFTIANGSRPSGRLTVGNDGWLYGTTQFGGSSNLGTVFRVNTNGALNTLVSFNRTNGANPYAEVIHGLDGSLYGTTVNGGVSNRGTIYRLQTNGILTTLVSFVGTNGINPFGGLVQDPDGLLYGTASYGGASGSGLIFRLTTNGVFTTLHSFSAETDGANPWAALIRGRDGSYYGTTILGGVAAGPPRGTVFQITTNGVFAALFAFGFNASGGSPYGALVQDASGHLYGTTRDLGVGLKGTVFRLESAPGELAASLVPGGLIRIGWEAWLGQIYQIQYKTNLTQLGWSNFSTPVTATNRSMSLTDSILSPSHFYRLTQTSVP